MCIRDRLLYRAMQYASNLNLTFALRGDVPSLTAKATKMCIRDRNGWSMWKK